jgi:hypothetical protein
VYTSETGKPPAQLLLLLLELLLLLLLEISAQELPRCRLRPRLSSRAAPPPLRARLLPLPPTDDALNAPQTAGGWRRYLPRMVTCSAWSRSACDAGTCSGQNARRATPTGYANKESKSSGGGFVIGSVSSFTAKGEEVAVAEATPQLLLFPCCTGVTAAVAGKASQ